MAEHPIWRTYYGRFERATGNPADAEDLTQELYLRLAAWEKRCGRFRSPDAAGRSMFWRVLKDWMRRKYSRLESVSETGTLPEPVDPMPGPEDFLLENEEREAQRLALRAVVQGCGQLFLLAHWDMSTAELAGLMKKRPSAIRGARSKIRKRLGILRRRKSA